MSGPADDDLLVAEARDGSPEAFGVLVARHQGAVRGFLRRMLGGHADADDLAQETFVAAWRQLDAYRGQAGLRVWLCGIAWRKAMNHLRSDQRRKARDMGGLQAGEGAAALGAGETMDLARALAGLPADQRAAVALCLAAGFTHEEAAGALDMPLGTIKSHVTRGRAKLLEILGDSDD